MMSHLLLTFMMNLHFCATLYFPKCMLHIGWRNLLMSVGLLICTLISENQGLEKLRSDSNLRKISGPAHRIFFSLSPGFFSGVWYKSSFFFLGGGLKKIQVCRTWTFSKVWSRPWSFKVQIKRPIVTCSGTWCIAIQQTTKHYFIVVQKASTLISALILDIVYQLCMYEGKTW